MKRVKSPTMEFWGWEIIHFISFLPLFCFYLFRHTHEDATFRLEVFPVLIKYHEMQSSEQKIRTPPSWEMLTVRTIVLLHLQLHPQQNNTIINSVQLIATVLFFLSPHVVYFTRSSLQMHVDNLTFLSAMPYICVQKLKLFNYKLKILLFIKTSQWRQIRFISLSTLTKGKAKVRWRIG